MRHRAPSQFTYRWSEQSIRLTRLGNDAMSRLTVPNGRRRGRGSDDGHGVRVSSVRGGEERSRTELGRGRGYGTYGSQIR